MSMPPEALLRAVRAGATIAPWVIVKLSGGEPTLHPRFLEYLSAAVAAGANEIAVISNAHRLQPLLGGLERCPRLRFSVNVPSCDETVYQRLTGAPLDTMPLR
jgi:molybdenum cofactor biosynthesis enzyme MoaA